MLQHHSCVFMTYCYALAVLELSAFLQAPREHFVHCQFPSLYLTSVYI
jgi:hypothetical protein